ncbi:MAG: LysM peptidoglycan-binding domain-containing protein [Candidatus Kerfeldbacteria bacterium]|nr:LysM peptidoglycan-binding domain-containing protein [Candidatus Kerfeldbacteria bacterium]
MNKKISFAWLVMIFVTVTLVVAWPVQAAEYGGIGGRPVNSDPGIANSSSWFIYQLKPGESKQDAAEIQNNSAAAVDVLVYAADSIPSSDGGFALKQKVDTMTGVGSWVRFYPDPPPVPDSAPDKTVAGLCSPSADLKQLKLTLDQQAKLADWCPGTTLVELHLASLQRQLIPFVITIPDHVDVGEHSGGIVIQKKNPEAEPGSQSAVILTTRVGVRIYETVPGEIIRRLALTRFTVTKNPKLPEYTASVGIRNTGNVSIENISTITVTDAWHKHNTAYTRTMQALPGQELVINSAWPQPLFGHYRFQATVTYDDSGQKTLTTPAVELWIIPWRDLGFGVGALVIVIVGLVAWRLIYRRRSSGRGWVAYTVRPGEDLTTMAGWTGVSWQRLARVNTIRPPYVIKAGRKLRIPPSAKPPQQPGGSSRRPTTSPPATRQSKSPARKTLRK